MFTRSKLCWGILAVLVALTPLQAAAARARISVAEKEHGPRPPTTNGKTPSASGGKAIGDQNITGVITPCGLFLSGGKGTALFLTLVTGKKVAFLPSKQPRYWVIDDLLIENVFATATQMGIKDRELRGPDLLEKHRKWEVAWTAEQNGWPTLRSDLVTKGHAQDRSVAYSVWTYRTPRPIQVLDQIVRQVSYLTVAMDGVIVVFSTPLRSEDDPGAVHRRLEKIAVGFERQGSLNQLHKTVHAIQETATRTTDCRTFLDLLVRRLP